MEYSGAFLQLYREEGFYLERTVHYLNRVGLEHAKKAVVEDSANRKALYERLLFAVQGYEDPWQQAVKQPAGTTPLRREFEILAI